MHMKQELNVKYVFIASIIETNIINIVFKTL